MTTSNSETAHHRVQSARRGLTVFFAFLVPLSCLGYWLTLHDVKWVLFLMWTPALASLLSRLLLREGFADISLRLGGKRTLKFIPIVLLLPIAVDLAAYGIAWMSGLAQFAAPATYLTASPIVLFIFLLLANATLGTIQGLIGSFGEEVGWRGYMLTRLIDARVPRPVLVSGLVWGVWHLPLMVAGVYYAGPFLLLSILLFMVTVTSFGYVMAYLRLTSGSIWPAVLLHASWNAITQNVFDLFTKGDSALLWTGESGIFVALALLAVAFIVSRKPWTIIRTLPGKGERSVQEPLSL
ncbi:type II CAAX endopeptidase family protein [Paenibacillus oleatilyticus]|uniref:type II CAAX endopeptidase family protein n=1 Tax=Paenibacillus oleatilyticus TaxID=2594886 RepID=UPI001C1F4C97|nr:type II CAAX endopeptidase family protein [Paenibacillus oleatilyticus]MBU7314801.1 CPBP family intramembrane metalloprotease [Paenibacillus oleatilyticus]